MFVVVAFYCSCYCYFLSLMFAAPSASHSRCCRCISMLIFPAYRCFIHCLMAAVIKIVGIFYLCMFVCCLNVFWCSCCKFCSFGMLFRWCVDLTFVGRYCDSPQFIHEPIVYEDLYERVVPKKIPSCREYFPQLLNKSKNN